MGARTALAGTLVSILALAALGAACGGRAGARPDPPGARPAALAAPATPRPEAELLTLRVRAYADAEHREQTPRWDARIAEQVARASAALEAELGVRLEVESIRSWDRAAPAGSLDAALRELSERDPGREVDWVVGYVGALAHAPAEHDALGAAEAFGRHLVLRAVDSPVALAPLGPAEDALGAGDRHALALERRRHREAAAFLHAWAHTLGAVHECESRSLMAPRYSLVQSRLSPESARLVRAGLAHRDAPGPEGRRAWLAAYDSETARLAMSAWSCDVLDEGLAAAREELAADPAARRRLAHDRYLGALVPAVVRQWRVPAATLRPEPGSAPPELGTSVVIRLDRDGGVTEVRVSRSSGIEQLDRSVVEAVEKAQPFTAPPPDLLGPGGELEFEARFHARR